MRRVLRFLTDDGLADAIVGDLAEERSRRAAAGGPFRAAAWHVVAMSATTGQVASRRFASLVRQTLGSFTPGRGPGDLRHAVRSLRRAPWYAGTVVGVIALSMALATTVFAVVDGVLFKPLPYAEADELYSLEPGFSEPVNGSPSVSLQELQVWADAMPEVQFTAFRGNREAMLETVNERDLGAALVQPNFFDILGVRPLIGGFAREHFGEPSNGWPAIISYRLWQDRFDGAMDVLGREIETDPLAGMNMVVVGVLPEGFVLPSFEDKAEVLLPLAGWAASRRGLEVVLRLPLGVTRQAAQERLEQVMLADAEGKELSPGGSRFQGPFDRATLHPLGERMASGSRTVLGASFAAVALVVLIACVNVSGLMAARSLDRASELGLRRALGAGPGHLVRAVVTENAVLLLPATVLGAAASPLLLGIVVSLLPDRLLLLNAPAWDWGVAAFTAVGAAVCLFLTSLWPVRRALRQRSTPRTSAAVTPAGSLAGSRLSVGVQVALGVVLTVAGTLLVGSVARVWQNEPGFEPDGLAFVELRVQPAGQSGLGANEPGVAARVEAFLGEVRRILGVESAGATDGHVLDGSSVYVVSFVRPDGGRARHEGYPVTAGFFDAVGLQVRAGRLPTNVELDAGEPLIVVSQAVAAEFWPGVPAVGQILLRQVPLSTGGPDPSQPSRAFTVVGVVDDTRFDSLDRDAEPTIYGPYSTLNYDSSPVVAVRARDVSRVLPQVMQLAQRSGPELRAIRAKTATAILADTIRQRRFLAWLFGAFAVAALTLVGVGILGVVAMAAARRTREVGIRMALGSTRDGVVRLLAGEQLKTVVAGLLMGGLVTVWAVRFVESYLYGLTAFDARVWVTAVVAVLGVSVIGSVLPALRASRINPVVALRDDA